MAQIAFLWGDFWKGQGIRNQSRKLTQANVMQVSPSRKGLCG